MSAELVSLSAESIEAIAERVVDLLRATHSTLEQDLGRSPDA